MLRDDHAWMVFEHDFDQIGPFLSDPRNVVGENTATRNRRASRNRRGPDFRGAPCLCFEHPAGPAGQKRHSQPRKGPRKAQKAFLGRCAPNYGEPAILMGTSPMFCF